jgi:hypothetical protein
LIMHRAAFFAKASSKYLLPSVFPPGNPKKSECLDTCFEFIQIDSIGKGSEVLDIFKKL